MRDIEKEIAGTGRCSTECRHYVIQQLVVTLQEADPEKSTRNICECEGCYAGVEERLRWPH